MGTTWKADDGSIFFSDGTWIRVGDRLKADVVVKKHAADCTAYENQIADLEEERDAAVEFAHTVEREFSAAIATLERLREVVPEGRMQCLKCECNTDLYYLGCGDWRCDDCERELSHFDVIKAFRAILYPQPQPPEATNEDR